MLNLKNFTTTILIFLSLALFAQDCNPSTLSEIHEGQNTLAKHSIGALWFDKTDNRPFIFPKNSDVSAIFTGSFWLAAKDAQDQLYVSADLYGQYNNESVWRPGIANDKESCENWDKHFTLIGSEVNAFQEDLMDGSLDDQIPESVLGWPGNGNPHFEAIHGFKMPSSENGYAPFEDVDQNGIYNPMQGDVPIHKNSSICKWWIMNDFSSSTQTSPVGMEVQVSAYTFANSSVAMNNSTIYDVKLVNRSNKDYKEVAFSLWLDPDLGCPEDDYIGSLPENNLVFLYNQDAIDGTVNAECPGGVNTYGEEIPVIGFKQLIGFKDEAGLEMDLNSFIYHNRGIGQVPENSLDPRMNVEYFNFMNGLWKDGTPLIVGGQESKFAFPGNPADHLAYTMCTANLQFDDRRMIVNFGHFALPSNASNQMSFSVTGVENIIHPCPDITSLIETSDEVEELWRNESIVSSTKSVQVNNSLLKVYPNPSKDIVKISLDNKQEMKTISLRNIHAQVLKHFEIDQKEVFELEVKGMTAGFYLLTVETNKGELFTQKLFVE